MSTTIALVKPTFPLRASLTKYVSVTMIAGHRTHVVVSPSEVLFRKDGKFTISSRKTATGLIGEHRQTLDYAKFVGMLPNGRVEGVSFTS